MKKIQRYISLLTLVLLMAACDNINEADRLIYEKPVQAQRVVLLEDFTGQRCNNCPKATEIIEQMQQAYGESIVAVGIHGGPLGFKGNATNIGLATDIGDEYYNHWSIPYQPYGYINRSRLANYPEWAAIVKEELSKQSPVNLTGSASLADGTIHISIQATSTSGTVNGKLQVWLIEDNITAMQIMPDGSANRDYVHRHVLRTPVNGTWGVDLTLAEGGSKDFAYQQTKDAAWNAANLSVVAFVYTDGGVQQAVRIKCN